MIELEKESQLLEYFMRHTQLLTHTQIHQHLWKMAINPVATSWQL